MTMHVKVSGVWKEVTAPAVRVGGLWKNLTEGWVKVGGVWKQFFGAEEPVGGGDLTITPNHNPITGSGSGNTRGGTVTSQTLSFTITGGSPGGDVQTWVWNRISVPAPLEPFDLISTPVAPPVAGQSRFTWVWRARVNSFNSPATETWRVRAIDFAGNETSAEITVSLDWEYLGPSEEPR